MQGILTGKYQTLEDIPIYRRRTRHFDSKTNEKSRHGERGFESLLFKTLEQLKNLSMEIKVPLSDIAIASNRCRRATFEEKTKSVRGGGGSDGDGGGDDA